MRKLFTGLKILLPQIEEKTTPTKIKRIAKKYDISIDIIKTADDKKQINFPIEKREAKNLLKFLNEQMYTGELTQLQYHSNSQAVLPTSANEETQSDNTEQ